MFAEPHKMRQFVICAFLAISIFVVQVFCSLFDGAVQAASQDDRIEDKITIVDAQNTDWDSSFSLSFATADGSSVTLSSQRANGQNYFFLPSGVSTTMVIPQMNLPSGSTAELVGADGQAISSLASGTPFNLRNALRDVGNGEQEFSLKEITQDGSSSTSTFRLMQSANLASVHFTSDDAMYRGRVYIDGSSDHTTSASGKISVLSSDSTMRCFPAASSIKGRGNSTWSLSPKKSYQVKLEDECDLLDPIYHDGATEKAKKWLLIANCFDPTLMRNEMSYELAKSIDMPSAIDAEAVDFYYDGEYRGSFLLTEKVEVAKGRVEINDLEEEKEGANPGVDFDRLPICKGVTPYGSEMQYVEGAKDPVDISGGYLLELDLAFYESEKSWFRTSTDQVFVSKSPEYLSEAQVRYVSSIVNDAFVCLQNGGFNPYTGKSLFEYFDKDSLVRYFYLQQFTRNVDQFYSSTYFYIPSGEKKLYAGPLWDCDKTFGLRCDRPDFHQTDSWYGKDATELMRSKDFSKALYDAYVTSIRPQAKSLLYGDSDTIGSIDYYSSKNAASRMMNAKVWGLQILNPELANYESYDRALATLKSWASQRLEWVDQQIIGSYVSSLEDQRHAADAEKGTS